MTPRRNVAVLMVADDPAASESYAASIIDSAIAAGHRVAGCAYRRMDEGAIRTQLVTWISDREVDLIVACGGIEKTTTPRALAPLVTARLGSLDAGGQIVRCGSTLVVMLTASTSSASMLESALRRLDPPNRVASPSPPAPPAPPPSAPSAPPAPAQPPPAPPAPRAADITTGSIARIGDLPASVDDGGFIDLRSGKGGMWTLAAMGLVAVAGVVVLGVHISERNRSFLTPRADDAIAAAPPPPSPPSPRSPPPHVAPAQPAPPRLVARVARPAPPSRVATTVSAKPRADHVSPPARPAPPLEVAVPVDDGGCDEATCAVHNNERECCTPFRATSLPASLDRAMVAQAIAGVKAQVLACGTSSAASGVVEMRAHVGGDGRVVDVSIDEAPEVSIGSCVVGVIRATTFRRSAAGGSFVYRFEL